MSVRNQCFRTLDGNGFLRVVDTMGDDSAIVQAARVSYGEGTKTVREDRDLIRYLMRHKHTTPFESCEIKLHVKVPMDTWRQWIRHRTASVNEYSTRYSEAIEDTHTLFPYEWRKQSRANKQGGLGLFDDHMADELTAESKELHAYCRTIYNRRLDIGVAREQARKDLPLCTYTEAYWKIDLKNLLDFCRLRCDSHAQSEIREYANIILHEVVQYWVPLTYEAFQDYVINAVTLSAKDIELLKHAVLDQSICESLSSTAACIMGKGEYAEFCQKLGRLGFSPKGSSNEQ